MDRNLLERTLHERFEACKGEARAVARQAGDLADSGQYERDVGAPLSPEVVISNLEDAPDDDVASRWNWWMGALDLAYGGAESTDADARRTELGDYVAFQVRRFEQ